MLYLCAPVISYLETKDKAVTIMVVEPLLLKLHRLKGKRKLDKNPIHKFWCGECCACSFTLSSHSLNFQIKTNWTSIRCRMFCCFNSFFFDSIKKTLTLLEFIFPLPHFSFFPPKAIFIIHKEGHWNLTRQICFSWSPKTALSSHINLSTFAKTSALCHCISNKKKKRWLWSLFCYLGILINAAKHMKYTRFWNFINSAYCLISGLDFWVCQIP